LQSLSRIKAHTVMERREGVAAARRAYSQTDSQHNWKVSTFCSRRDGNDARAAQYVNTGAYMVAATIVSLARRKESARAASARRCWSWRGLVSAVIWSFDAPTLWTGKIPSSANSRPIALPRLDPLGRPVAHAAMRDDDQGVLQDSRDSSWARRLYGTTARLLLLDDGTKSRFAGRPYDRERRIQFTCGAR